MISKEMPTKEIVFFRSLNFLNGMNNAEGASWVPAVFSNVNDLNELVLSHDMLKNVFISNLLPGLTNGCPVSNTLLSVVTSVYTKWEDLSNARSMFIKFVSDVYFHVPGVELSMLHANDNDSKSWLYSFETQLGTHILQTPKWVVGANHMDELLPVFGFALSEYGENDISEYVPEPWELQLAESVMTLWSDFAKEG